MAARNLVGPDGAIRRDALAVAAYRGDKIDPAALTLADLDWSLQDYRQRMLPLRSQDARFRSSRPDELGAAINESAEARAMVEALKMIGRKIRPEYSASQASHWCAALVAALSDLPPAVAVAACKAAIHQPVEFPGQVERVIRAGAEKIIGRHKMAVAYLQGLRREILSRSQLRLVDDSPRPLTQEEVDQMSPEYQRLGLKVGALIRDPQNPDRLIPNPEPE